MEESPEFNFPFETALEVSPQVLSVIQSCEKSSEDLKEFLNTFRQISDDIGNYHAKLETSYGNLASHLKKFKQIENVSFVDPKSVVRQNVSFMSDMLSEISDCQRIAATCVTGTVVPLVQEYVDSDLVQLKILSDLHKAASNDVDRAIARYCRLRRKDSEQERHEATEEVFRCRKKYHQITLKFYAKLNQMDSSAQYTVLESMVGILGALGTCYRLGNDCFSNNIKRMTDVRSNLKSVSDGLVKKHSEDDAIIHSITTQSQLAYYPMPAGDVANLPVDQSLANKSGYLNVHRKYMGVMSSWERQFTFIKESYLMTIPKGETTPVVLLELGPSTVAHAADTDDRLHVFSVISAKRTAILQALNDRERDEWMIVIQKHAQKNTGSPKTEKQQTSILSDVGNYFAEKFQSAVGSGQMDSVSSNVSLRRDVVPKDAPIVFDLLATDDDETDMGLPSANDMSGDVKTFSVRFLGSMNVQVDSVESFLVGQPVVFEVMRRILEARAVHNLFTTSHLYLSINATYVVLRDPLNNCIKHQQKLRDISFWAAHSENPRLVGYIVKEEGSSPKGFSCYVFESDDNGKDICTALGTAARMVYAHLLDQKVHQKKKQEETKLLLQNIAMLPDIDSPVMSPDGSSVVLEQAISKPKPKPKNPESEA